MITKEDAKNQIRTYTTGDYPYDYDYILLKDYNNKIDDIYLSFENNSFVNELREKDLKKIILTFIQLYGILTHELEETLYEIYGNEMVHKVLKQMD